MGLYVHCLDGQQSYTLVKCDNELGAAVLQIVQQHMSWLGYGLVSAVGLPFLSKNGWKAFFRLDWEVFEVEWTTVGPNTGEPLEQYEILAEGVLDRLLA